MERREVRGGDLRSAWPIIVGGCHRTGTSLVRRLLDAHSRIHCGPEIKFFRDFYGDYFDDPLAPYRFARTARSVLPEDALLDILGQAFVEVHVRAAARAGKPRWADKAPENVLYTTAWGRLLGDEWLLVHVVRNPLDTLASMKQAEFPLTFPPGLEERIAFYRLYTEAGLNFAERNHERCRVIVYEKLVEAPADSLGALMEWLGESPEPTQLAFNVVPHEEGLEDRRVAETTKVHSEGVGRWRENLTTDEAAAVWAATSDLWGRIDPDGRTWAPDGD